MPRTTIRLAAVALLTLPSMAACTSRMARPGPEAPREEMAVTIDDLPVASATCTDIACQEGVTRALLDVLRRQRVPATGFVNEGKLDRLGPDRERSEGLLRAWLRDGHDLGNHTFSHPDLHAVPLDSFQADVLRGDPVTRRLMAERGARPRWFRHPFLRTGRDSATRAGLHGFLDHHGYRVAPVTIDNSDYVFAAAWSRAGARGDSAAQRRVGDAYVAYMDTVVGYYQQQARQLFGRPVRHVLLLHANPLNAARGDDLFRAISRRGFRFVTLDRALEDPAYTSPDRYTGPGGISWLHRWALTQGRRGDFFAGEPEAPAWVGELARSRP